MIRGLRHLPGLFLFALLLACSKHETEAEPVAPVALVELQTATTATLNETLTAYGTAEFAAAGAASLSVQAESRVLAVLVATGAEVKAGQPLLTLAPTATTTLALDAAHRDAALTEQERARQQRLRDDGLANDAELAAAINAATAAKALSRSLDARVGSGELSLRAARAGIVDELSAKPGDVLVPGVVALRIASPDALQLRLGIEPEDAVRIHVGQPVTLMPLASGAETIMARVAALDRRVDPQTRLTAALVQLPAGQGLPGAVLRGEILIARHANVIAIPRAALLFEAEQAYAYVAVDGKAGKRKLKTGLREGERVEISEGLSAGEAVVIAGNAVLEDGMALRTEAAPAAGAGVGAGAERP